MPIKKIDSYTCSPEIKKSLPHGTITRIADKYKLSYVFVWNVASGRVNTRIKELVDELITISNEQ